MKPQIFQFQCITPCFCAGANQAQREIRPSAIRGALRWWFRALGGSPDLEKEVFGGSDPVQSSAIMIRVSNVKIVEVGKLPEIRRNDPLSYILYFPSVAADETRWTPTACVGPKTSFNIQVFCKRKLSAEASQFFNRTLLVFRHYGAIGMHVTRGLGSVQDISVTKKSYQEADQILRDAGFQIQQSQQSHRDWKQVMTEAGKWLKNDLRKEFGAGGVKKPKQATALGSAEPRQTSALHLQPIKLDDVLCLAVFEAPHERVLGDASRVRHSTQIMTSRDFTKTPPG